MYLFIDESGDTGFTGSSTKYFVISIVVFTNINDMLQIQNQIENFKEKHKIKTELHSVNLSQEIKNDFFKSIKYHNIYIIYFEKKNANYNAKNLYVDMLRKIMKELSEDELKIRIDGKQNKKTQEINIFLRKHFKVNSFKMVDSKNDVLIQLADMVANRIYIKLKNNEKIDFSIKKCLCYLPD
ncbi:MAG: hypothetical protein Ta2D_07950 [Rickettsiales bacterium]|nr:MAG: hypothetical protein Ta2D_07950 [Rickettsiales bacterium]